MKKITSVNIKAIEQYTRAADYLSVAQIFLQDNVLLSEPLRPEHIKPRLLGHFGTCPGINFVYAHLNAYIAQHPTKMLFILGPGHGFPAIAANTFMDGSLSTVEGKTVPYNFEGMENIIKKFSWPFGFPSHVNPSSPGAILEGGELGYSLSTAYGAVLDNPDLVVPCLIGDGEAETGPLATSWHAHTFLDPTTSGAVLPILHLNGYKISGPTIFGRMSNAQLTKLFEGYGYNVHIVDAQELHHAHESMASTLAQCMKEIQHIQETAKQEKTHTTPVWPMIILRSPKGWHGLDSFHGTKIEGNAASHQVVLPNAKKDPEERAALEQWLRSYHFEELYSPETGFTEEIQSLIPKNGYRIGEFLYAKGDSVAPSLTLPDLNTHGTDITFGQSQGEALHALGKYMKEIFTLNPTSFRLFSPDETYSNKLQDVFDVTARAWQKEVLSHDKDLSPHGRVIEMLSEHTLQGLMQGYILTGRYGVFPSYEAFLHIVSSMTDQYAKFLKASREVIWRDSVPPFIYILSSLGWRQDHNGYSHQNPSFVSNLLQKHQNLSHVYFPVDTNSALAVMEKCLHERSTINAIVAEKHPHLQWRTLSQAKKDAEEGIAVWDDISDPNPDLVLSSAGDYPTIEILAALQLLRKLVPQAKIRYVNVLELTSMSIADPRSHTTAALFHDYFTSDKPVIFNYHGYPTDIKHLLFDAQTQHLERFHVHGYQEEGSTTTPFDMQVRNKTDRYHIAIEALTLLEQAGICDTATATKHISLFEQKLTDHRAYIIEHGEDPEEITSWTWTI